MAWLSTGEQIRMVNVGSVVMGVSSAKGNLWEEPVWIPGNACQECVRMEGHHRAEAMDVNSAKGEHKA